MDKSILIVDSNPEFCHSVAQEFDRQNFATYIATDVHTAFSIFCSKEITVVLCNSEMNQNAGFELLARIKAFSPETPVVLVLPNSLGPSAQDALDMGARAVVVNPATLEEIQQAVHQSIEKSFDHWTSRPPRHLAKFHIDIEILNSGAYVSALTQNIGRGGLFVTLPEDRLPEVGTLISFELYVKKPFFMDFKGEAIVRWTTKQTPQQSSGMGIEFIVLSDQCRADLIELTEHLKKLGSLESIE